MEIDNSDIVLVTQKNKEPGFNGSFDLKKPKRSYFLKNTAISLLIYTITFFVWYYFKRNTILLDPEYQSLFAYYLISLFFSSIIANKAFLTREHEYSQSLRKIYISIILSLGALSFFLLQINAENLSRYVILGSMLTGAAAESVYFYFVSYNKGIKKIIDRNPVAWKYTIPDFILLTLSIYFFIVNKIGIQKINERHLIVLILIYLSWFFAALFTHKFNPLKQSSNNWSAAGLQIKFYLLILSIITLAVFTVNIKSEYWAYFIQAVSIYSGVSFVMFLFLLKADHPDVLLDGGAPAAAADMVEPGGEFGEAVPPEPEFSAGEPVAAEARVEPVLRYEPDPEELAPLDAPIPEPAAPIMPEPPLPAASEAFQSEPEPVGAGGPADYPAGAATGSPIDLPAASPVGAVAEAVPFLSPRIDFIAAIDVVEPVAAQRIVDAPRDALARVRKPVRWIGYDEASGEWQPISTRQGGEYRHIRAGLQLVDRQGAVSENDLAIFASAMQDLADQLTGIADLPARQQAFETAMQLDQFCAGVDIQIGINVISQGQAFPGTKLRALAEAAGMTIDGGRRRFVRRDEDGNVLYALLNQEEPGFSAETMRSMSTHGLTFLLDVPCVAHGERVFNQMVDLARRFADVLHGVLVDDNRRPLSEAALEPIRRQIAQYQAMLAARQLPAGTPLTQRLFS